MKIDKILPLAILMFVIVSMMFAPEGITFAQENQNQSEILSKLDQVLNAQKAITNDIAAMKEELNIIKIRVTQTQ